MKQLAKLLIIRVNAEQYFFKFERPTENTATTITQLVGWKQIDAEVRLNLQTMIDLIVQELQLRADSERQQRDSHKSEQQPLEQFGRFLYLYLLPATFRAVLEELTSQTALSLMTNDEQLPWELLHNGKSFLMLKHPMARQLLHPLPPQQQTAKSQTVKTFLFVANPTSDLPESSDEVENLVDTCDASLEPLKARSLSSTRATKASVLQALSGGNYAAVHYSGHALPTGLELADGLVTLDELSQTLNGRPFVFVNGCRSAQQKRYIASETENITLPYAGLNVKNLATTFILSGATAFLGSLWDIFDESSRRFAEKFYALALQGTAVGEALRQARLYLYQENPADPLWASYILYGDPHLRLLMPRRQERRQISIQTIHLVGLNQLYEQASLEQAGQMRQELWASISNIMHRFGGQRLEKLADTVSFQFGIPQKGEDDATRAILAAGESLQQVAHFNGQYDDYLKRPLTAHIGIASGQVSVWQDQDKNYQIAGAIIGTAADLATAAQANQILLDLTTKQMVVHQFATAKVTDEVVEDPIYELQGIFNQRYSPVLLGRTQEINQLEQWWQEALHGRGRLVHLIGPAGIGKSLLAHTVLQTTNEGNPLQIFVKSQSFEKTIPNALLAQIIRGLLNLPSERNASEVRAYVEDILSNLLKQARQEEKQDGLALIGQLLGWEFPRIEIDLLEPNLRQRKLIRLIQTFFAHQAAQQPVILVLDDLHWADEVSVQALSQLLKGIDRWPIFVLALYRPDWVTEWINWGHSRSLTLNELDDESSKQLLEHLLGHKTVPEDFAHRLLTQVSGNPFFLEEMIKSYQEAHVLTESKEAWLLNEGSDIQSLPTTVENVILARLDRLPDSAVDILRKAAVLGEVFEHELLDNLQEDHPPQLLEEALDLLAKRDFIVMQEYWPSVTYRFRHGLIRVTVYSNIAEQTRQRLHRLVGQLLSNLEQEQEGVTVQTIAYHYHLSDDHQNAIDYCLKAGELALGTSANQIALDWYTRAMERIEQLRQSLLAQREEEHELSSKQLYEWRVEGLTGKGNSLSALGRNDEAIAAFLHALALTASMNEGAITQRADLYHRIAVAYHNKGELSAAEESLRAGLESLNGLVCIEGGRLMLWTSIIHYRRGQLTIGLEVCEQGIEIIKQTAEKQLLAQAFNLQGLLYRNLGRSQDARRAHEQSIGLYEEIAHIAGLERAYSNLGCVWQDLGDWDQALHYFQESARLSERTGETWRQAAAAINVGEIYRLRGELSTAVEIYKQALSLSEEYAFKETAAAALLNLGDSYRRLGELLVAKEKLEAGQVIIENTGLDVYRPALLYYQAELAVANSQLSLAEELATEAQFLAAQTSNQLVIAQTRRLLGEIYQIQELYEAAGEELLSSLKLCEEQNNLFEIGLTCLALAELKLAMMAQNPANNEELRRKRIIYCERAVEIFKQLGAEQELQRALSVRAGF